MRWRCLSNASDFWPGTVGFVRLGAACEPRISSRQLELAGFLAYNLISFVAIAETGGGGEVSGVGNGAGKPGGELESTG